MKTNATSQNHGIYGGSVRLPPPMPAGVYQRNGIAYKPSRQTRLIGRNNATEGGAPSANQRKRGNADTPATRPGPRTVPSPAKRINQPVSVSRENTATLPHGGRGSNNEDLPESRRPMNKGLTNYLHTKNPFNQHTKATNNKVGSKRRMRVYIKSQMQPGKLIRVLCPDNTIMVATVPPQSEWSTGRSGGYYPFFRVTFDPSAQASAHKHCTCTPSLGVFDSRCPCLGTTHNPGGGHDSIDDEISIAREEGGSIQSAYTSTTRKSLGWECKACSLINEMQNDACRLCNMKRRGGRETTTIEAYDVVTPYSEMSVN